MVRKETSPTAGAGVGLQRGCPGMHRLQKELFPHTLLLWVMGPTPRVRVRERKSLKLHLQGFCRCMLHKKFSLENLFIWVMALGPVIGFILIWIV